MGFELMTYRTQGEHSDNEPKISAVSSMTFNFTFAFIIASFEMSSGKLEATTPVMMFTFLHVENLVS